MRLEHRVTAAVGLCNRKSDAAPSAVASAAHLGKRYPLWRLACTRCGQFSTDPLVSIGPRSVSFVPAVSMYCRNRRSLLAA
ncbi:hypothetical protein GGH13_008432 [Coemansia sp. S155-1]|nr:hypothetical protein GGH13_008432 [Coemansia sp. S155-1]